MRSVTYSGDGSTTAFAVNFPYLLKSDVDVYVGGVLKTNGTDYDWTSDTEITFTAAPSSGTSNILFERTTDVVTPAVDFADASALLGDDLDSAVSQVRYAVEELQERVDAGGLDGDTVPTPTAANDFMVGALSGSNWVWLKKTLAQTQSILGIGASSTVPDPTMSGQFIVSSGSPASWSLSTLAATKTLLAVPTAAQTPPDPSGQASRVLFSNSGGTGYELKAASAARSALGLGSAATTNAGAAVGNTLLIVNVSGSPGLPAIDGSQLTGLNKFIDYSMWEVVNDSSAEGISSGTNSVMNPSGCTFQHTVQPANPGWVSSQSGNTLRLNQGRYYIRAQVIVTVSGDTSAILNGKTQLKITATAGTITPLPFDGLITNVISPDSGSTNKNVYVKEIETMVNVNSATGDFRIDLNNITSLSSSFFKLGEASAVAVRIHIQKFS